jgi:hypothetical protein
MAGSEAEKCARRERESDLEKNGTEEPLEEAAENARGIYRGGKTLNEFAHGPGSGHAARSIFCTNARTDPCATPKKRKT